MFIITECQRKESSLSYILFDIFSTDELLSSDYLHDLSEFFYIMEIGQSSAS